jgi:hypothetical protein
MPQFLPDVLDACRPPQKPLHSPDATIERATDKRAKCAIVRGTQRVDFAPVSRDDRKRIIPCETIEKILHHGLRQEWQIARGDEDMIEPRGGETGFDASEWSLPTRPLADDVPDALEPDAASSDYQHFVTAACEPVQYVLDQGHPTNLDGELIASHPAATATGEDHTRGTVAQGAALAVAPSLKSMTLWRSILTRSMLLTVPERRARRFARARSTAAE